MARIRGTQVKEKKQCLKCKNDYTLDKFYISNTFMMPEGRSTLCKNCVNEIIQEQGFDAVLEFLRSVNKPFLADLWKDDFNDYIRQINSLPQHKNKTWEHSIFNTLNRDPIQQDTQDSPHDEIDEKKIYSKKWMGEYSQSEINYLEDYYRGLDRDFKIVTTNHKDYAKKICKASLHMDICFQDMIAGVTGADKRYKDAKEIFDTLSKSAQFSESQRGQNDVSLGAFGVTFDMVEKSKWIPKHTPMEKDSYDKLLDQFSSIKESV